jgi:hypothetical protein
MAARLEHLRRSISLRDGEGNCRGPDAAIAGPTVQSPSVYDALEIDGDIKVRA